MNDAESADPSASPSRRGSQPNRTSPIPDLLGNVVGETMTLPDYYADFERHFWAIDANGFWKLERQQYFQEPGYDSWEAFARGDWAEALQLLETGRKDMSAYHRRIADSGFVARRVRVVEEPITGYLQWELHALRIRDECGGPIRVVSPEQVSSLETSDPLPEIYTLGSTVMYQAVYDEHGILAAARRFTDPDLIAHCRQVIADLYAQGVPLAEMFARSVAGLPAPNSQHPT